MVYTTTKVDSVEIRSAEGERKSLVYDNYSKLIGATGTISEVHSVVWLTSRCKSN